MATIILARENSNNSIQRNTDVLWCSYTFGTGQFLVNRHSKTRVVVGVRTGELYGDRDLFSELGECLCCLGPAGKHPVFALFEYAAHAGLLDDTVIESA